MRNPRSSNWSPAGVPKQRRTALGAVPRPTAKEAAWVRPTPRRRAAAVNSSACQLSGSESRRWKAGGVAAETRALQRRLDDVAAGLRGAPLGGDERIGDAVIDP